MEDESESHGNSKANHSQRVGFEESLVFLKDASVRAGVNTVWNRRLGTDLVQSAARWLHTESIQ